VIAPFEYSLLILAVSWGYLIFDEVPDLLSIMGMALIVGSSLFIFIRESIRNKPLAIKTSLRT
jgi:S-adenosylmethionine uptake transporter